MVAAGTSMVARRLPRTATGGEGLSIYAGNRGQLGCGGFSESGM